MNHRPEQVAPADIFYGEDEAKKYTQNTRMIEIQRTITERALQMLAIPRHSQRLLLDIGCGSGISGQVLSEHGHMWVGMDISHSMLDVAADRELEGDLIHSDMGHGFGYRSGTFDGAVSISALQWLCSAEKKVQNPYKRLNKFFQSLYACLIKGARCAFQFYPSSPEQVEMITNAAMKNGFTGGLIIDYPNSKKAKKYYLFLMAGYSEDLMNEAKQVIMPQAKMGEEGDTDMEDDDEDSDEDSDEEEESDSDEDEKIAVKGKNKKSKDIQKQEKYKQKNQKTNKFKVKNKEWIQNKKDRQRRQGKKVRNDSKYSGRRRSGWYS